MPKIKVTERKLGRERAVGLAWIGENFIEIDSRLKGRARLAALIHEVAHLAFPDASETKILGFDRQLSKVLWDHGFRRIDK